MSRLNGATAAVRTHRRSAEPLKMPSTASVVVCSAALPRTCGVVRGKALDPGCGMYCLAKTRQAGGPSRRRQGKQTNLAVDVAQRRRHAGAALHGDARKIVVAVAETVDEVRKGECAQGKRRRGAGP